MKDERWEQLRIQVLYTWFKAEQAEVTAYVEELRHRLAHAKQWISDMQSGMYINCVYCGHRYGPADTTPTSKAEMLTRHIEQCPEHPMSKLMEENTQLRNLLSKFIGDDGPDLDAYLDGHVQPTPRKAV